MSENPGYLGFENTDGGVDLQRRFPVDPETAVQEHARIVQFYKKRLGNRGMQSFPYGEDTPQDPCLDLSDTPSDHGYHL